MFAKCVNNISGKEQHWNFVNAQHHLDESEDDFVRVQIGKIATPQERVGTQQNAGSYCNDAVNYEDGRKKNLAKSSAKCHFWPRFAVVMQMLGNPKKCDGSKGGVDDSTRYVAVGEYVSIFNDQTHQSGDKAPANSSEKALLAPQIAVRWA